MNFITEKMLLLWRRLKAADVIIRRKTDSATHGVSEDAGKSRTAWPWLDRLKLPGAHTGTTPPPEPPATGWRARHPRLLRIFRVFVVIVGTYVLLPYVLIPYYRFIDPPISTLMVRRALGGAPIRQQWVDFEDISPHLVRAVVLAEDASFCRHHGVDWNAVGEAIEEAEDGDIPRGASTIPMQTAKNLFLWPGQDYLRKALELPLAYYMSAFWPKQRVIEVYLNIAEWGRGVFGAEAAARYHFGKSAAALTPHEAALLAGALPNPRKRNAGRPGPQLTRIAEHIQARMGREARDVNCVFD